MSNTYDYTTTEQQIKKLEGQLLTIGDKNFASQVLKTYGYYNIINGYRDPYIIREYGEKKYSPDVTFEQIFSLFALDHEIRDAVLMSMIDLEEHLRAIVADIIAADFGCDYKQYLSKDNYRDKFVRNPKFRRNNVLADMVKTAETAQTQPIKYYREHHHIIPAWILLKGVYFGTLVNFIRFFKSAQREKLIHALYGQKVTPENMEHFKNLLSDTLATCLEYRNLAAHGGRIYNYLPQCTIRALEGSSVKHGLPQLLCTLNEIEYSQPFDRLDHALHRALNEYCPKYPNDIDRLEKSIGFTIISEEKVWINRKTKIMHINPHCSGSCNLEYASLTNEINQTYSKCKRCFQ